MNNINLSDFFAAIYAQARGLIYICASLNSVCLHFSSLLCSLVKHCLALKLLPVKHMIMHTIEKKPNEFANA